VCCDECDVMSVLPAERPHNEAEPPQCAHQPKVMRQKRRLLEKEGEGRTEQR